MEFKRKTIEYSEKNRNHKAAEKLHVAIKRIREWRQNKLKIFEPTVKPKNKRYLNQQLNQRIKDCKVVRENY